MQINSQDSTTPLVEMEACGFDAAAPPRTRNKLRAVLRKNYLTQRRSKKQLSEEFFRTIIYLGVLIDLSFTVTYTEHPADLRPGAVSIGLGSARSMLRGLCSGRGLDTGCFIGLGDASTRNGGNCSARMQGLIDQMDICADRESLGCKCVSTASLGQFSELEASSVVAGVQFLDAVGTHALGGQG